MTGVDPPAGVLQAGVDACIAADAARRGGTAAGW
jgi:hypothetical protein